ncbi:hypothetical protein FRC08_007488 [Ceratobasidium sp. 394]|nr:hypothetical protein FRC08_007488 [Ceratobasidium sp. 394]
MAKRGRNTPRASTDNNNHTIPPEAEPIDPQQPPEKHSKFYLNDSLVTIRVEGTIFNVHKSQLLKSEAFRDMFSLGGTTSTEGGPNDATSDEHSSKPTASGEGSESNPIMLSGIRANDFEKLLTMLYTFHYSNDKPVEDTSLLVPALRLANMWNFSELRALLIPLAEKTLNDVDKIIYSREFGVAEWLAPAHVQLCMRDTSLTKEEAAKVGFDSLLIISHLREKARAAYTVQNPQNGSYCYGCGRSYSTQTTYTPNVSYFQAPIKAWVDSNFERIE